MKFVCGKTVKCQNYWSFASPKLSNCQLSFSITDGSKTAKLTISSSSPKKTGWGKALGKLKIFSFFCERADVCNLTSSYTWYIIYGKETKGWDEPFSSDFDQIFSQVFPSATPALRSKLWSWSQWGDRPSCEHSTLFDASTSNYLILKDGTFCKLSQNSCPFYHASTS